MSFLFGLRYNSDTKEHMEGRIKMSNKRLYRVREGAMLSGVCQGLATYFKIDATIIRLIWAIITISSFGFGVILYIACTFIIPLQPVNHTHQTRRNETIFDSTDYTVRDADDSSRSS